MSGHESLDYLGRYCSNEASTSLPTFTYWRKLLVRSLLPATISSHESNPPSAPLSPDLAIFLLDWSPPGPRDALPKLRDFRASRKKFTPRCARGELSGRRRLSRAHKAPAGGSKRPQAMRPPPTEREGGPIPQHRGEKIPRSLW
jgi:hypothetical protein